MGLYGGAVRQPLNDLAEFDLTKRQPEEMARLFARWKEQRRSLQGNQLPPNGRKGGEPRIMPIVRGSTVPQPESPPPATQPTSGSIRYSAPFVDMLVADGDRAIVNRLKTLRFNPAEAAPPHTARRREKLGWVFAGMPWMLAVAAFAALFWQQVAPSRIALTQSDVEAAPSTHSSAVQADSEIASAKTAAPTANHSDHVRLAAPVPVEIPPAARLIPAAIEPPVQTALPMQEAIDAALMRTVPSAGDVPKIHPKLKPQPAAVQVAKKAPDVEEPAAARLLALPPLPASKEITSAQEVRIGYPATATIDVPPPASATIDVPPPGPPPSLPQTAASLRTHPAALDTRSNDKKEIGDHASGVSGGGTIGGTGSPGAGSGAAGGGTSTGSGSSGGTGAGGSGSGAGSGGSGGSSGTGGSGDTSGSGGSAGGTGAGGTGSGDAGSGGTGSGSAGSGGAGSGGTGSGGTGSGDAGSGSAGSGGAGSGGTGSGSAGSGGAASGGTGSGGTGSGDAGSGGAGSGGAGAGGAGAGDPAGGVGGSGGSAGGGTGL